MKRNSKTNEKDCSLLTNLLILDYDSVGSCTPGYVHMLNQLLFSAVALGKKL